jgi:hypothetical protein
MGRHNVFIEGLLGETTNYFDLRDLRFVVGGAGFLNTRRDVPAAKAMSRLRHGRMEASSSNGVPSAG